MIKRSAISILLLALPGTTLLAQTKSLTFGAVYANYTRQELDSYIDFFTNAVGMPDMKMNNAYGFEFSYTSRTNNTEGIFGGSYTAGGFNKTVSIDNSRSLSLKHRNFDIHFGLDQYITSWFFVGGQFLITNFSGIAKYENVGDMIPADTLIDNTGDNPNIFVGYAFGIRGETGFYIPFKKEGSGMKIMGYYDVGINKYNFYESFDKVITSYTDDKKTRSNAFGIQLLFAIPMGGG